MRSKILAVVLLALAAASAPAEEKPGPMVEVKLKLISMDGPILAQGYRKGGVIVPLVIAPDFFTEEFTYRGPPRFELFRIAAKETTDTELTPKGKGTPAGRNSENKGSSDFTIKPGATPTAWVDLPTSAGPQHLILLVSQGKTDGGIKMIEDNPSKFPYGSWRFFNLCEYGIEVQSGATLTKIPSKNSGVIKPKAEDGTYFDGEIFTHENLERRSGYSFHALQLSDARMFYFVMPGPPDTGQVLLKGVQDRLLPAKAGPPPGALPERKSRKK